MRWLGAEGIRCGVVVGLLEFSGRDSEWSSHRIESREAGRSNVAGAGEVKVVGMGAGKVRSR